MSTEKKKKISNDDFLEALQLVLGNSVTLPEKIHVGVKEFNPWYDDRKGGRSISVALDGPKKHTCLDIYNTLTHIIPKKDDKGNLQIGIHTPTDPHTINRLTLDITSTVKGKIIEMADEKRNTIVKELTTFKELYNNKLHKTDAASPGFFTASKNKLFHGEGIKLIERIDTLLKKETASFSEIQTLAQAVTSHIEKNQKSNKGITANEDFKNILNTLKESLDVTKPVASDVAKSSVPAPR